jgi:hypothetical protein
LGLAISALICLAAPPVVARQCPRGEYLRVSKGICVPRADARKHLGSSHLPAGNRGVVIPEGMEVMHSEAYAPAKTPSSGALEAVEIPRTPKASSANTPQSPYGELTIESFAKH